MENEKDIVTEENTEECEPCKILSAAGLLIGQYCNKDNQDCDSLVEEISEGRLTIRELGELLNAEEDFLKILEEEGVPLDTRIICEDVEEGICKIVYPEENTGQKGGEE